MSSTATAPCLVHRWPLLGQAGGRNVILYSIQVSPHGSFLNKKSTFFLNVHIIPHHITPHHITSHHGMEYCCSMSAPALPCHFHCKQEPARETQHTNHYYTFPSTARTQLCNANSAQSIRCLPIWTLHLSIALHCLPQSSSVNVIIFMIYVVAFLFLWFILWSTLSFIKPFPLSSVRL